MTKVEKIQIKYEKGQADKESLAASIEELKEKLPALKAEAERLAEAGDLDGYIKMKEQVGRAEAELHVKELQVKKIAAPIAKEEALAAWKEYIKPADAKLDKKFEEYKKARKDLCAKLLDLMDGIQAADNMRKKLLQYCGIEACNTQPNTYKTEVSQFCMKDLTPRDVQVDCQFFQKTGEITFDKAVSINSRLFEAVY